MNKCNKCKYFFNDTDFTCYHKFIVNEFTGEWEYGQRKLMNSEGHCDEFKKINRFFGLKIL
jgi:hypothetical protein